MAGKTALLGWELGAGVGYAVQLHEIATALAAAGHKPVQALRSIEAAGDLVTDAAFPVVQAPWIIGRLSPAARRDGFYPTGFADLMAVNGFGAEDHLESILRGWRGLIDLVRPDLVVATYAPGLSLAAFGRVPVLLFGSPYTTPPADGATFPTFRDDIAPYADQTRMLEVARAVQRRFAAPTPERVTDLYRGDVRVVASLPELDPYASTRHEPLAGMFEPCPAPVPAADMRFYAYFAEDRPATRATLRALLESGRPGDVYVRDADPAEWDLPAVADVRLLDRRPGLAETTRRPAVVVHHGGLGVTHAALAAGRPQILAPRALDQFLTAAALRDRPFVRVLAGDASADVVADALDTLTGNAAQAAAMAFAETIQARGLHGAGRTAAAACLDLLG